MLGRLEALVKLKVGCLGGACLSSPPLSMAAERLRMAAQDCKCRYQNMVQLCHLPRRRMQLLSTPPQNSSGCLRSTGSMALFCGGVDRSRICLLGMWQSWTMLRYLHLQSQAAMCVLSAAMLQGGKIDMLPLGSLPSIFPEPPDVPACITPKYSEVYETM